MTKIGTRVTDTGTLSYLGGEVEVRRDVGGCWSLDLHWVPTGMHGMRVRIVGAVLDDELISVEGSVAIHL